MQLQERGRRREVGDTGGRHGRLHSLEGQGTPSTANTSLKLEGPALPWSRHRPLNCRESLRGQAANSAQHRSP